jgi:hypothetical protein
VTEEPGGPYVAMAVLCEKVLQEKDGVLSAIRVIDRIVSTASGPEAPARMPPVAIRLTALLSFRSGIARGSYTVTLRPQAPSGRALPALALPVHFEGEDRGANLVLNLDSVLDEEGVYWFDVLLGEQRLTRMPLRVIYQRMTVT